MQLVLINKANLASGHGTEKSMEYLESRKKVEESVQTGDDFLPKTADASSPPASHSITLPVEPPYSRTSPASMLCVDFISALQVSIEM